MATEKSVNKSKNQKRKKPVLAAQTEPVKVKAVYKNAPTSPQKARLVADLVRGKSVQDSLDILAGTRKKASKLIMKVLQSALANAQHNSNLSMEALYITRILIDDGIKFRRFRAVSRGRAHGYVKRRAHILIELSERK